MGATSLPLRADRTASMQATETEEAALVNAEEKIGHEVMLFTEELDTLRKDRLAAICDFYHQLAASGAVLSEVEGKVIAWNRDVYAPRHQALGGMLDQIDLGAFKGTNLEQDANDEIQRCRDGMNQDQENNNEGLARLFSRCEELRKAVEEEANPVTNLDSLCGDLQRVQAEFLPAAPPPPPPVRIAARMPEQGMCCRMLGLCNGRTDFVTNNSLNWAADGSLCSNTASN